MNRTKFPMISIYSLTNVRQIALRSLPYFICWVFLFSAIASLNKAQTASTTRPDRGFGGGGGFQSTDIDSISLQNGALNLHIPLASLPPISGGKLSFTLEATYNSKLWQVNHGEAHPQGTLGCEKYPTQFVGGADTGAGWQIGAGYTVFFRQAFDDYAYNAISETCEGSQTVYNAMILHRWFKPVLLTPDGSEHEMRIDGAFTTFPDIDFNHDYLYGYYQWPGDDPNHFGLPAFSTPIRFYTIDGTFLTVTYNPPSSSIQWTLYMKDGARIEQSADGQRTWDTNGNSILLGADSNGSFIKDERTGREVTWHSAAHNDHTDTIVRFPSVGGNLQTVTVHWGTTTVQGKTYSYTTWDPLAEEPCVMPFGVVGGGPSPLNVIRSIDFPSAEQSAPARTYTFAYNSDTSSQVTSPGGRYCDQDVSDYTRTASYGWGEVSEVVTPSGADIKYTYGNDGTHDFSGLDVNELEINAIAANGVGTKSIQHDGTTDTWIYGGGSAVISSLSSGGGTTNPDGSVHEEVYYPVDPAFGTCCGPGTQAMQGRLVKTIESGRILVEKHWTALSSPSSIGSRNSVNGNPVVDTEYTTLLAADGQTRLKMSAKTFTYDLNGDLLTTTEYDWFPNISEVTYTNPGSPMFSYLRIPAGIPSDAQVLRVTTNSLYNSPGTNANSNNLYFRRGSNPSALILGKVQESDVGDLLNTQISKTLFCYDGDASCTSAPTLGNLTKVRAWDSARSDYSDTVSTYTSHGNVQSITDPNGHVTQFSYGTVGTTTDLYPTQTVQAYGTSVARTSAAVYDFYTGLVTTATDVDNNVATATTYDIYGRPTLVQTAVATALETQTQTVYHDGTPTNSDPRQYVIIKTDQDTVGDGKHVAVQFYDQLGRVRLTKTLEDSSTQSATNETDGIKVETRFGFNDPTPGTSGDPQNTLGSYVLTSNPFRAATSTSASNEPTMGWTLNYSERSGVHSDITTFSGAGLPVAFGGSNTTSTGTVSTDVDTNRTLVTDQAGKQRISASNAVGQLKEVWEITGQDLWTEAITFPNTSIAQGYKTLYNYDVLNNLTTVIQGSQLQNRTFAYSSLSRLTSAFNPESGTTNYVYDAGGNLHQKTDARGVEIDYTYDALNRLTNRNYSTPSGTPPNYQASPNVTYTYDDPTIANSKGKLTKVSTGTGTGTSTTEYLSFDILGRVTRSKQTTDGVEYGGGTDPNYWMTYSYNLAGALMEQQYPSGRRVKNVLTNNGDLSIVESKKNPTAGYWHYADTFSYSPSGAVTSLQLGNGHWESTTFNGRLQPVQIDLGTSPGSTNLLQLDYSYGTTQNNGNVLSQTIIVPTALKNGNTYNGFVAVQNYSYDALNRIDDAWETVSGNQTWRQDFVYDRNGNRTLNEANTTTIPRNCGTSPNLTICSPDHQMYNPAASPANNRLDSNDGYAFDTTGNIKSDPENRTFIYDSENKQIEVKNSSNDIIGDYFYDGDGKRIKKIAYNPSGVESETTIFLYDAAGKQIAEYSDVVANSSDAKVAYLTQDTLGSPRINTDSNGAVAARHDYLPFGEEAASSERASHIEYLGDTVRKKFTGYERDGETQLDYAKARYYGFSAGRFISPDPQGGRKLDPQSLNKYPYVRNNPLIFVDPTGERLVLGGIAADDLFEELQNATGYSLHRCGKDDKFNGCSKEGEVVIDSSKERKTKGTSKVLAEKLKDVINLKDSKGNSLTVGINAINGGADGDGIFIDTFAGTKSLPARTVDVGDLQKIRQFDGGSEFVAGQLGHILEEYSEAEQMKADVPGFNELIGRDPATHGAALKFESKVLSELLGDKFEPRVDQNSGNISFFLYNGEKNRVTYQIRFAQTPERRIINTVESVIKTSVAR